MKLTRTSFAALMATGLCLLIAGAHAGRAQMITNGGFETPVVAPGTFMYAPMGSGWNFEFDLSGITHAGPYPWNVPGGWVGSQVAVLQNASAISRSITFPVSGAYCLTYLHAGRGCCSGGGNQHYDVLLGSTVLASFTTFSGQPFTPVNVIFYRNPGTEVLRFQGRAAPDHTAFLDEIAITVFTNAPLLSIYTAVEVCCETATNKNYQAQWSPSLNYNTNWTNLGAPFAGTGSNVCFLESTRGPEKRYYRVITLE
jgi:hypothetical protein